MGNDKIKIIPFIISAILSLSLANFGSLVIKEFPENYYLGLSIILISFLVLYLSDKIIQVRENNEKIKNLSENIEIIERKIKIQEKLLNTISNIIITERVHKNGKTTNN